MTTWIFQGNPERFDLDGYLRAELATITWVVRQHVAEIATGDTVFFWRSAGKDKEQSGVVAECRVASSVTVRGPDTASLPFWTAQEPTDEARVDLVVIRVAASKQVLKRDWLKVDPVLGGMLLFRQAQGTNFRLTDVESSRLNLLWSRTGVDWTWRDSVAGLWAYVETSGKEVSKLAGSPVADVALVIGRAVSGVYNKVMNFRALDPSDPRKGFSGGGDVDEAVWETFFNRETGSIDRSRLLVEMNRVGLGLPIGTLTVAPLILPQAEASGPLPLLLKRYEAARAAEIFPEIPVKTLTAASGYLRNPLVVSIAKSRAKCACEIPGCSVPTFQTKDGELFCEVHHVEPLSEGGKDVIENVICLCPLHHREAHHGKFRSRLREQMKRVRSDEVSSAPMASATED